MDPAEYCREVEAYLCRKNDGHLIRIVGPVFEQVCCWAEQGVPLSAVFQGIDRRFERYYARGPRRRPLRLEFCEADVLDLFDEWRRAVGVPAASTGERAVGSRHASHGAPDQDDQDDQNDQHEHDEDEADDRAADRWSHRRVGLQSHLDRVIVRLTALCAGQEALTGFRTALERVVHELDHERAGARAVRGNARIHLLGRLRTLDETLLDTARHGAETRLLDALRREAESELTPFRGRMPSAAFERALERCTDRLLRDRLGLPRVSFDS